MHHGLLQIGEMAAINHTTVPTLRLYDTLGLLKPTMVDPQTGYRYYSFGQNARLDMISYMKELGMSLEEIASVLQKGDVLVIEQLLSKKNEQLHQQMRELKARHDAVERAIASLERYRKSPLTGTISLEYIDHRRIWGLPCTSDFYKEGIQAYEAEQDRLRQTLLCRGVSQVHTYNVGTSIQAENYRALRFLPDHIFIFTDEHFDLLSETHTLDSGMYACIYADSFDQEPESATKLLQYCKAQGYHIAGDYLCEIMTEFNVFNDAQRGMFLRLQVPIHF